MIPKVKTSGAEVKEVNKRQRQFDEDFFFEMRNHPLSRLLNAYYMGRKFKPCVPESLDFIMAEFQDKRIALVSAQSHLTEFLARRCNLVLPPSPLP